MIVLTVFCIMLAVLFGRRLLRFLGVTTLTKTPLARVLPLVGVCPIPAFARATFALDRTFESRSFSDALVSARSAVLRAFVPTLSRSRCPRDAAEIRRMAEDLSAASDLESATTARSSELFAKLKAAEILTLSVPPEASRLDSVLILSAEALPVTKQISAPVRTLRIRRDINT
jgi:hypothetical protein